VENQTVRPDVDEYSMAALIKYVNRLEYLLGLPVEASSL
jgi:hypothetical protein